ncbi:hypothetical protein GQX74_009748 [Glossina fuscipes]|nr:hypothetical protein GQX74_009748 [Glossina fuscipes]
MTSPLRVTWVNSLRRNELQACLGNFDLDIIGTAQEMRRRWAQFINQDYKPEVVTQLLRKQHNPANYHGDIVTVAVSGSGAAKSTTATNFYINTNGITAATKSQTASTCTNAAPITATITTETSLALIPTITTTTATGGYRLLEKQN